MYHNCTAVSFGRRARRWLAAALACMLLALGLTGMSAHAAASMDAQAAASVRQAVLDAAVQCYAVEGVYPPDLAYLEKNYGLQINHEKFIVTYDAFASNLLPDIAVLQKNT